MRTRELQDSWNLWLNTSEDLLKSLYEQTVAITLRDTSRIERLMPESERMLCRLRELDAEVAEIAKGVAASLGTESNVRDIAANLEKSEAQALSGLANRVTVASRTIHTILQRNQELYQNRYAVVQSEAA